MKNGVHMNPRCRFAFALGYEFTGLSARYALLPRVTYFAHKTGHPKKINPGNFWLSGLLLLEGYKLVL